MNPLEPDSRYEIVNEEIEGVLKDIGQRITSQLPDGWVFSLTISSVGEKGSTFYISNTQREDVISLYKEMVEKLNKNKPRIGEA